MGVNLIVWKYNLLILLHSNYWQNLIKMQSNSFEMHNVMLQLAKTNLAKREKTSHIISFSVYCPYGPYDILV